MTEGALDPRDAGRIHGLDALRGVLMLLGVVVHAVLGYFPDSQEVPWAFREPGASGIWAPIVFDVIHIFRMPAFFVISGFFGALLWEKRGARAMLKNRLERVLLPLGVFVVLLWPLVVFGAVFAMGVVDGSTVPWMRARDASLALLFTSHDTFHLWFLYYLIWIVFAVAAVVRLMEHRSWAWPWLLPKVRSVAESPWQSLLVFGLLNFLWFMSQDWSGVPVSNSWRVVPSYLLYYGVCYVIGWIFFVSKTALAPLKHRAWTLIAIGLACVAIRTVAHLSLQEFKGQDGVAAPPEVALWELVQVTALSVGLVAFTRGFAGLFVRYASSASYAWRYLSDSSYWVYLIHLPLTALVPALLVGWHAPTPLKFLVAVSIVSIFCVASYDLAVRATFVGRFLNGRRYSRYSLRLSALACVVVGGCMSHAMVSILPPVERQSPWLKGSTPQALLPDEHVVFPLTATGPSPADIALDRCIGVQGYAICPDAGRFDDAHAACKLLGGALIVLESQAENRAVAELVWKLHRRSFWMALTDREKEGEWRWSSGELLASEESWAKRQPDNWGGMEHCATNNVHKAGKWNDANCRGRQGFVCRLHESPTGSH